MDRARHDPEETFLEDAILLRFLAEGRRTGRSRPRPVRAGSPCRRVTTGCGSDSWASDTIPASEPRLPHTLARGCARRWPSGHEGPSEGRRNRTLSIQDRRASPVRPGRAGRPDWLAWAPPDSRLWGRALPREGGSGLPSSRGTPSPRMIRSWKFAEASSRTMATSFSSP